MNQKRALKRGDVRKVLKGGTEDPVADDLDLMKSHEF